MSTLGAVSLATALLLSPSEPGFTETPLALEVDGMRFPAVLTLPAGDPISAVLLVPGSLFTDVDGDYPSWNVHPHMYADLARQLAARGHAVLRYAKPGPGTGTVVTDPERSQAHLHFSERVVVARAALKRLREELGAKASTVRAWAVAGHSEGAVVASLLAPQEPSLDGLVLLSGPSIGLLGIMRDQTASMSPAGADLSFYDAALARIRKGEPLPPDAARNPQTALLASMDPRNLGYLREVDAVDPAAAIAGVDLPVLLVQGGRDASVPAKHVHRLQEARGTKPTRTAFFDDLQHFYKHAEPGMDPQAAFALSTPTDPRVAEAIDGWLRTLKREKR